MKFAKFVGAPFSQSTTGRLLLLVAVSVVVKGELVNKTVNDLKRVQMKEQVSEAVVRRLQIRWC